MQKVREFSFQANPARLVGDTKTSKKLDSNKLIESSTPDVCNVANSGRIWPIAIRRTGVAIVPECIVRRNLAELV